MRVGSWLRWSAVAVGFLIGMAGCGARETPAGARGSAPTGPPTGPRAGRVLVYSRTAGFRHPSIEDGKAALVRLGVVHHFAVDLTEDPSVFTDEGLAPYRVVVFLHTTGRVLEEAGQEALERWLAKGNGWVGVHGAADGDPAWPWYLGLVGADFTGHPAISPATIDVEDWSHPATRELPREWKRTDEWYNFAESPRPWVRVLASMDEHTFEGGTMGADHPIAWCQRYGGGRSFYTALGHTPESWAEPLFLEHVLGGIRWAAGGSGDRGLG